MLQHSRRRDSLKPSAAGSADLYLRLVRRGSEMYQRPEAIRVVAEPATQSGRIATRCSPAISQTLAVSGIPHRRTLDYLWRQ